jgi:hypothetical protein
VLLPPGVHQGKDVERLDTARGGLCSFSERVERTDAAYRYAAAGRKAQSSGQRDPDTCERARPTARRDAVELCEFYAGLSQHLVDCREDPRVRPRTERPGTMGEFLVTANQRDTGRRRCRIQAEY